MQMLCGPVKCVCSCRRDVCDCGRGRVLVGRRGPRRSPAIRTGARAGRTLSVTYLPVSPAPGKGRKCVVADVAVARLGRLVTGRRECGRGSGWDLSAFQGRCYCFIPKVLT